MGTMTAKKIAKPNGTMTVKLPWYLTGFSMTFTGGPFDLYEAWRTPNSFGMCVRAEAVPKSADAVLKIQDYNVPKVKADVQAALEATIWAALSGKDVYVGCMGGWGRTGLFFALIAKALGAKDPVAFVRSTYTSHAVETTEQMRYVDDFDVTELRSWLIRASWKAVLARFHAR